MSFKKKEISDDAPALADSHDGSVAAPASSDNSRNGPVISKRTFLKGAATAPFVAAGANYSVGRAEAIPPLVIAGAAVGASVAVGWALREFEVIGSDSVPDGMTQSALEDKLYDMAQARLSNDRSTFVDNQNITESGIKHSAYADAKIAAIEQINNQETQQAVQDAGVAEIDSYETTVLKNLYKSWNETAQEFWNGWQAAGDHPDTTVGGNGATIHCEIFTDNTWNYSYSGLTLQTNSITLPDGTTLDVNELYAEPNGTPSYLTADPNRYSFGRGPSMVVNHPDRGFQPWFSLDEWTDIVTLVETAFTDVRDGFILWVDNVYGSVQEGEIDITDLLTPREQAEMTADDEDFNQAVADLMALNMAVALEREAEVYLPDVGATVYGSLGVSGDTTLSTGSVDPSADELLYFFTYDVSEGSGDWTAFTEGVDGGIVEFTSEPWEQTEYHIDTSASETAVVAAADFTDQGDGTYTVDISDQVEMGVTNIDQVTYYATATETQYETVQLKSTFEIVEFTDSEGNSYDSTDYTQTTPQDDTNYITQEQWEEQMQAYEDSIAKYEQSTGGGGGFSFDQFAIGDIPGVATIAMIGGGILLLLNDDD